MCSVLVAAAMSCSGGSGGSNGPPPGAITSTSTTVVAGAERAVAVVADSEISSEVVDLLDGAPDLRVVYRELHPGERMADLDGYLAEALARRPEVLVYSGGANDLSWLGPDGMLRALRPRLDRAAGATCLVYVAPTVDVSNLPPPQQEQARALLAGFDQALAAWKVRFVSYSRLAAHMHDAGERFFAEGELGSFHPGPAAHPVIAEAIARTSRSC